MASGLALIFEFAEFSCPYCSQHAGLCPLLLLLITILTKKVSVYQFYGHPGHDSHVLFATMTASTAVLVAYVLGIRMVSDSSK